ncbi:Cadherin tumor suppressor [Paragonimus heterotremus]|uniref:Cadherin tumor suppressor n=1 Tax=Paragonimus heterotremus TaxID=100268 RepID=A0A8J4WTR7_9TREM|nr:Cadherin tumor suppressor [Paragonimus heterotremus]
MLTVLLTTFPSNIQSSVQKLEQPIVIDMPEELPRTTLVAELSDLIGKVIPDWNHPLDQSEWISRMSVKFLEPNTLFYIQFAEPDKHYLRIQSRVDREADCSNNELCCHFGTMRDFADFTKTGTPDKCTFTMLLLVEFSQKLELDRAESVQRLIPLHVRLLDINDNAPTWKSHSLYSINLQQLNGTHNPGAQFMSNNNLPKLDIMIAEHTAVGTRVALPLAADPDAGPENTTASYVIEAQTVPEAFVLDWQPPSITSLSVPKTDHGLFLVVNKDLSYDRRKEHHVLVSASDAGVLKRLTGNLLLNISITDVNDHPPTFATHVDRVWIPEHVELGTKIYQPVVHDADSSDQFKLTFDFLPSTLVDVRLIFQVDSKTGEVSVIGVVDYEVTHAHHLFIFVSDGKWTDEMQLHVIVINRNDNPPEIQLHSHLAVLRKDGGPYQTGQSNAQLTIAVPENGPPNQMLATLTVTDKDSAAERRANAYEKTSGIDALGQKDLTNEAVLVKREKSNQPTCSLNTQQLKIEPLRMYHSKQVEDKFRFKITLAGESLDRERQNHLIVNVLCHDQDVQTEETMRNSQTTIASEQLKHSRFIGIHTSTATLRIQVLDENDSPPVFVGPRTAKLAEDAPVSSVLLRLQATDADDPHTSAGTSGLRYRLLDDIKLLSTETSLPVNQNDFQQGVPINETSLPPRPWFQLNPLSGELRPLVNFDRELIRGVLLSIEIRDGADSHPIINKNTMNNDKSVVTRARVPFVQATSNRINVTILIEITDANDCAPKFSQQLYEFNVSEDTRPPSKVGKVTVTDCDIDSQNKELEYWLQTNVQSMELSPESLGQTKSVVAQLHSWFSVSKSGDVFLRTPHFSTLSQSDLSSSLLSPLDRERNELVVMDIFARDSGTPSLTGSAQLLIRVLDVNDHAPEWEFPRPQHRIVNLSADTAIGNGVAQIWKNDKTAESGRLSKHRFATPSGILLRLPPKLLI